MKAKTGLLLAAAFGYVLMFAGVPTAGAVGVGACIMGNGGTVSDGTDPFVGVNAGTVSPGAYQTSAEFEAACCAETNQPPDCFEEV